MKNSLVVALILVSAGTLSSQSNAFKSPNNTVDTLFPFNIPLLNIDSTKVLNSKTVMAIAKKEQDRKPTVIAFWLTTCIPCHHELATYTANYAEWKKQANFNFYAVSTDFP